MSLSTKIVTITPEQAAELLENNVVNRPPKGGAIKRYAEDMKAGRWVVNGEAIIVREDGILLNGQNRLMACIEAEVPFETMVVYGVNGDALDSIDIGQARSLSDQLHWRGVSNSSTIAAAVKWAWRYDRMVERGTRQLGPYDAPRDYELDYFDRQRHLFDAANTTITPLRRRIPGMQSVPLFVHFLIHRMRDNNTADAFYQAVAYDSEHDDDAASVLKDWLLNNAVVGSRPSPNHVAAIHIKAARYWLAGEKPKMLMWKHSGDKTKAELFPRIDGAPVASSTASHKKKQNGDS